MPLVILNGASGAGKTTIAEAIDNLPAQAIDVVYQDRAAPPPSTAKMIEIFGSPEAWQKAVIFDLIARLAPDLAKGRCILFDCQSRFSHLTQAAERCGISDYTIMLIDCDDETRTRRLSLDRDQAELATADMMNWAHYLRSQATAQGYEILDTSNLTVEQSVDRVLSLLRQ